MTSLWLFSTLYVCISLPACSSASADRPARYRRWHLVLLVFPSSGEPFVGQPLASRAIHKAFKPRERVILHVTLLYGDIADMRRKRRRHLIEPTPSPCCPSTSCRMSRPGALRKAKLRVALRRQILDDAPEEQYLFKTAR
jgi:hypothetical protein